ncbi:MAG TPA: glutaredoxin domain-containing protein [Candidatus Acidoferrales bacterium]|nr:glutaredoxin domain-containing protein [Candidatus Acidoferrales bacterium]
MIKVYGTESCGDCKLAKRVLAEAGLSYEWIDIDSQPDAAAMVQQLNGGMKSVPTILFPDGRVMVEPTRQELTAALAV